MGKQWVDITTIDNNTPFTKVRWRGSQKSGDKWFSETPGLVTDSLGWQSGNKNYGWFSAHRMNAIEYCASFDFDRTASGVWDVSGKNYQVSLKNGYFTQYYDTTVQISDNTYYEVDFNLWQGASGYKLYAPFSTPSVKWSVGDVYVEIGGDPIVVDKDKLSFKSSGETKNVVVTADNAWTATTSEAWVTLSTSAGTSGETTLSVTAPEYTSTTEDRTATITITDGEFSVTINVKQAKKREGGVSEMYLGTLNMEAAYFGDLDVEAIYLGEYEVYSSGPKIPYADCQITTTAASETVKIGYTYQSLANLADVLVDGVSVKSSLVDDTYTFADAGTHIVRYVYTSSTATDVTRQVDRLESYEASKEVLVIGQNALNMYQAANPSQLASISLPGVEIIDYQGITNTIATDIYAPKVTSIGNKALQFNPNLDPVSMPLSGVTSIGNNALRASAIKEAHFGKKLTTYEYNVFNECYSLSALTFNESTSGLTSMPSVGDKTYALTEIVFPDCITTYAQDSMSYGMITNSSALTSVTLGSGSTTIQGLMFKGDVGSLVEINCYAATAPTLVTGCFGPITANTGTLHVPAGSDYSTWATELGENWTVLDDIITDYSTMYTTLQIVDGGTLTWNKRNNPDFNTLYYSLNNGSWTQFTTGSTLNVVSGDKVRLKGNNSRYASSYNNYYTLSGSTATYKLYGNIDSLIHGDSFTQNPTSSGYYSGGYNFCGLFAGTKVLTAEHLILPSSFTLPSIYESMFGNCTLLTKAPDLLYTGSLSTYAYTAMFNGCTSLSYIKCLCNGMQGTYTNVWTTNVAATGTFVKKAGVSWPTGQDGIPSGWTVIEE